MKKSEEVIRSAEELGISYEIMPKNDFNALLAILKSKYLKEIYTYPTWEYFKEGDGYRYELGWQLLADFITESCIFFLEVTEEEFGIELQNGKDLVELVGNAYGMVFYVTNKKTDYLICFNNHDYLIGAGSAERWIGQLKSQDPMF